MCCWSSDFETECNGLYTAFVELLQQFQFLNVNFIGVFLSAVMIAYISYTVTK
jgi:hypothetical protein